MSHGLMFGMGFQLWRRVFNKGIVRVGSELTSFGLRLLVVVVVGWSVKASWEPCRTTSVQCHASFVTLFC